MLSEIDRSEQEALRISRVEECLAQSHERYKAGDLDGALARVAEGLKLDPTDARLERIQARLRKALESTSQELLLVQPLPETPRPVPATIGEAGLPTTQPQPSGARWVRSWLLGAVVALSVLLALAVILMVHRPSPQQAAVAPPLFPVTIETEPEGATVVIDGSIHQEPGRVTRLSPGSHRVTASLNGYETATERFEIASSGRFEPVIVTLTPVLLTLRLSTDIEGLAVLFDQQPISRSDLEGGQFSLDKIAPGPHELTVSGRYGARATLRFQSSPGSMPQFTDRIAAENLRAAVVSSSGANAHVYATFGAGKATLSVDGGENRGLDENGLELNGLAAGNHILTFTDGKQKRELQVETGAPSALAVLLTSDRNVGSLLVEAGGDGLRVLIDGQEKRAFRQRGQLLLPNLEVKTHVVRVVKAGYRAEPEQQTVAVQKGELSRLRFNLKPISTLTVHGALPGAGITIDGTPVGHVADDGSFSSEVEPGSHTLVLSRKGYRTVSLSRQFKEGESVQLTGPDIVLEKMTATGTLVLAVTPPSARVTVQRSDGTDVSATGHMELPEGQYVVRASAGGYADATRAVTIRAGRSETVELRLPLQREAGDMSGWERPDAWERAQNNWFVRQGGDFVTYRTTPGGGRFTFSVRVSKGNPRWFVNYKDRNNYLRYEADKTSLSRVAVVDGKETAAAKVPHQINIRDGIYTVQIELTPNRAVVWLQSGSSWKRIDELAGSGADLSAGRMGLIIPKNTRCFLANFRFVP